MESQVHLVLQKFLASKLTPDNRMDNIMINYFDVKFILIILPFSNYLIFIKES